MNAVLTDNAVSFGDIQINTSEISQSALNIDEKTRSNLFTWNGQFSPQFVEALLDKYADDNSFVVDPFAGSGTTLYECARKGISAYGMELNASAFYMAKTYELVNIPFEQRSAYILKVSNLISSVNENEQIISVLTGEINNSSDSIYKNLLSTLIVLMDIYYNDVNIECLNNKWNLLQAIISEFPFSVAPIYAERGDARKLSLQNNTADLLITSPPYINVFNYHQKYRRSVEALGFNVLDIAKSEFGSNRKNRGNRFLTVIQYCVDMALSLKEASRVCKENARMLYVVGRESSVLGYSFCNSELVYNLATEIFHWPFLLRQERVFKNRFGQMIYEDIIQFSNNKAYAEIENDVIINQARHIAVRMLKQKTAEQPDSKNLSLLYEAIEKSDKVKGSIINHE